ncbi:hypothetical protein QTP88_002048 [Uroleucon formosanum]
MEDTKYFNGLKNFLDSSNIVNNISILGETSDLNVFIIRLLELDLDMLWQREKSKYRFSLERGELPIKFMGCQFLIKQHIYFECVNGPHHKSKDNTDMIEKLNNELKVENVQINAKEKYLLLLSLPTVHNHAIETSLLNLPINSLVLKEISRLVNNGFSNIKIVSSMLKDFVERTCTISSSPISQAFYLDEKTLRNCIIKFTYEKHQSKIDQHDLAVKIEQWTKPYSNDN